LVYVKAFDHCVFENSCKTETDNYGAESSPFSPGDFPMIMYPIMTLMACVGAAAFSLCLSIAVIAWADAQSRRPRLAYCSRYERWMAPSLN